MTREQKELLLKDLCGRQIYNVKCKVFDDANPYILSGILHNKPYSQLYFEELDWKEHDGLIWVEYCKPYLFPLSSMTEEQREEYHNLCSIGTDECGDIIYFNTYESVDYLNKNKFDYRGLISMGLALDATGLNIY